MFDNSKCDYAIIKFGDTIIEGYCLHWEVMNNGNGMVKIIINEKQYITALSNVLLTERNLS